MKYGSFLVITLVNVFSFAMISGTALSAQGSENQLRIKNYELRISISKNPFSFSKYYSDNETDFYYCKARYYSPQYGFFTSRDTYDLANRYVYCKSDPVNFIDTEGHARDELLIELAKAEKSLAYRKIGIERAQRRADVLALAGRRIAGAGTDVSIPSVQAQPSVAASAADKAFTAFAEREFKEAAVSTDERFIGEGLDSEAFMFYQDRLPWVVKRSKVELSLAVKMREINRWNEAYSDVIIDGRSMDVAYMNEKGEIVVPYVCGEMPSEEEFNVLYSKFRRNYYHKTRRIVTDNHYKNFIVIKTETGEKMLYCIDFGEAVTFPPKSPRSRKVLSNPVCFASVNEQSVAMLFEM